MKGADKDQRFLVSYSNYKRSRNKSLQPEVGFIKLAL